MKPAWSIVGIRLERWRGPRPGLMDYLRTATGRTYQIVKISGKQIRCVVLPQDWPIDGGRVFEFYWLPRLPRNAR